MVKMLPRKDAPAATANTPAITTRSNAASIAAAKREAKQRKDQTSQQWMEFSRGVVETVCDRLFEAAQAEQSGSDQPSQTVEESLSPFKLHPRAEVVAVRQLNWPDDFGGKIVAGPSLRLCYVRIEQKTVPAKVVSHYRRQLPDRKEHPIPGGLWIDSLTRDRDHNTVWSIDVLLTKPKTNTAVRNIPDQEQLLVVEILSIECADMGERLSLSASK